MRRVNIVAACCGAMAAVSPAAGSAEPAKVLPNLEWLDFRSPKQCEWSDEANRVFFTGVRFDERKDYIPVPATTNIPGISNLVTSRMIVTAESPNIITYYVDFDGRWNGLTVLGLMGIHDKDSLAGDRTGIRFAEPVGTVARKLAQAGFLVNANGGDDPQETIHFEDEALYGVSTFLGSRNGETVFLCYEIH
ncbi:hypothetical protein [Allopontixanthobacter sp.]|uniref:hypothetical protein n=1 Tax=Allopontixanthobacter sp. TaxID=2906452 RepID=UPI002ABA2053|nr:hypothetical protein [Allopontixanthobacter sp.]MDZ4306651.1 hypothetical protein [Allopontixanthobacter sp.]